MGRWRIRREMLPLVQEALGDRYDVRREIARGGAARVFYALGREDGEAYALKILHPELAVTVTADRFVQEVEVLSNFDHPQIAKVIHSGESGYFIYYVMHFLEGPTLRSHLDRVRKASVSDTERIAKDMLDAKFQLAQVLLRLDRKQDAAEIIRLTQVLHPDLGGPEMKARFETLLAECER